MAFNINDMKAQLTFGGARATLFQVTLTNPANNVAALKTPFLVKAAQLPESAVGTIEVGYFGRKIKYPGDRQFMPWNVTVINDEDFLIRNGLEEWSNRINGLESNLRTIRNLKSTAEIIQYAKTGEILRTYKFNGLWPAEIAPIEMNWDAVDQIQEYGVTFQYDSWEVSGGLTGNAGGR
jgi:hypothetical protein